MTGSNRRSNAGRKARTNQPKAQPKPQRVQRSPRVHQQPYAAALMNTNANYRPMKNGVTRISGSDYLGTVSVVGDSSTAANKLRKTFPVSPSSYPGTRMTQMSNLWERYRFNKFSLRYVPSVPNTLSAQVMVYQDTDPKDDPSGITDADALIRQATSQTGSQQWNFNQPKRVELASRADKELYYTGTTATNDRFNLQGKAYFIQVSDALDFNGATLGSELTCGSVYADWEVEFQTPQINPESVSRELAPVPRATIQQDFQLDLDPGTSGSSVDLPAGLSGDYQVECSSFEAVSPSTQALTVSFGVTSGSSTLWSLDNEAADLLSFSSRDKLVVTGPGSTIGYTATTNVEATVKVTLTYRPV